MTSREKGSMSFALRVDGSGAPRSERDGADAAGEGPPAFPFRVAVIAELLPRDGFDAGASPPEHATAFDASRFDDLFEVLRPRIAVEVPSVLAGGRLVRVDLAPTGMKSFRPDGLAAEVSVVRALLDGRLVVERLRTGAATLEGARRELERVWNGSPFCDEVLGAASRGAPSPAAPAPRAGGTAPAANGPDSGLDGLLSMVDLGVGGQPSGEPPAREATASVVAGIVARVARGDGHTPIAPGEAIARIDRALGAQVAAILQHPEVRRLEAAWRGLRFLADRAAGHGGIALEVVCARAEGAAEALERALDRASTPASLVVVDHPIDGAAASLARLEAVAEIAEAHAVPALVSAGAELLGVERLADVETRDDKASLFTAPARAPWRATAAKASLRWVAVVVNPVLARTAYEPSSSRLRVASVREEPAGEAGCVWIAPAYAVAALALQSLRATSWPSRIVGRNGGVLPDLPVREAASGEPAETSAFPTEALLSIETQRALGRMGIVALATAPNSDAAHLATAPTAYVPAEMRTSAEVPERVSLPDQLFVARLAQLLRALAGRLPADADPAAVAAAVRAALDEAFGGAGPESDVRAVASPGGTRLAVVVRPRGSLGVSLEEIGLELGIG